jgi:hypothetical protein
VSRRYFAAIGVVIAMLLGAGCGRFCHEIGCLTGVTVDFPQQFPVSDLPLDVTICADDVCDTSTIDPISTEGQTSIPVFGQLALDERSERDVVVRVEVRSKATNEVLIAATGSGRLVRDQPNGAGCDPVCYGTSLTYDEASNTLLQR